MLKRTIRQLALPMQFHQKLLQSQRTFGNWIPDGRERNDYEHKDFVPFNYKGHGTSWDHKKWPLNRDGKEQSPIALSRTKEQNVNLEVQDFSDKKYTHQYQPNENEHM